MDNSSPNNNPNMPKMPKFNMNWLYVLVLIALGVVFFAGGNSFLSSSAGVDRDYTTFKQYIAKGYGTKVVINKSDNTLRMFVSPDHIRDIFKQGTQQVGKAPYVNVEIGSVDKVETFLDQAVAQKKIASYSYENKSRNGLMDILISIAPWLVFFGIWYFLIRRMGGGAGGGGGVFSVGKSKAKLYEKANEMGITFKDVAGQTGAKQEVQEIVEFLKNPKKYTDLGGKIPKGALLIGPPGTGKTLLAKAVAGEAGVPFFSMSGSDFVEMFVGVGASRVRDVFRQAKEKSPCIIFIDEIDAVGRARSKNPAMGGNDERENTLNALLTEMDGFGTNSGVIVLAATNRVDMLDKALLRAGRFDRQIHVDLPDLPERKDIFLVHMRNLKLDKNLDIDLLARQTPGFSGADIANVCNEAALIAARKGKTAVSKQEFLDAVDRIVGGLEKKSKILTPEERKAIAFHEAGHATVSWLLEYAAPLVKVTIVPRGQSLGAAWYLPEERQIVRTEQILDEMCAALGGRAAEKVIFGMIAYAGMSDRLPNICYYNNDEYNFQKPYSDTTAKMIDEEVLKMINGQYDRAKQILTEHKEGHNRLAQQLMEREVIMAEDVEEIFGKRPWVSRTDELLDQEAKSQPKLEDMPEAVKQAQAEHEAQQRALNNNVTKAEDDIESHNTAE